MTKNAGEVHTPVISRRYTQTRTPILWVPGEMIARAEEDTIRAKREKTEKAYKEKKDFMKLGLHIWGFDWQAGPAQLGPTLTRVAQPPMR
jgi:hypothetical protein